MNKSSLDAVTATMRRSARCIGLYRATLAALSLAIPVAAAAEQRWYLPNHHSQRSSPGRDNSSLIDTVRKATARFRDINVAKNEGWIVGTPCVSGPNSGAMGVHLVLPSRVGDAVLDPNEPEALIYEPLPNGAFRLVGVEFIVLASKWAEHVQQTGDTATPAIEGHLTNYVGEPNRYGLPAFFELHVWAWERNPNGSFADWNTQVSCDRQAGE